MSADPALASLSEAMPSAAGRGAGCPVSPSCAVRPSLLARYGLRMGQALLAVHIGPIGPERTPLALHAVTVASPHPPPQNSQRSDDDGEPGRCLWQWLATRTGHHAYQGCRLDFLAAFERPTPPTRRLTVRWEGRARSVWVLEAAAWSSPDGPCVRWRPATEDDGPRLYDEVPGEAFGADVQAELARLTRLVLGRATRPGRRSRAELGESRPITERAIALRTAHPSLSWAAIAEALNVSVSTLLRGRRLLELERGARAPVPPHPPDHGGYRDA